MSDKHFDIDERDNYYFLKGVAKGRRGMKHECAEAVRECTQSVGYPGNTIYVAEAIAAIEAVEVRSV